MGLTLMTLLPGSHNDHGEWGFRLGYLPFEVQAVCWIWDDQGEELKTELRHRQSLQHNAQTIVRVTHLNWSSARQNCPFSCRDE